MYSLAHGRTGEGEMRGAGGWGGVITIHQASSWMDGRIQFLPASWNNGMNNVPAGSAAMNFQPQVFLPCRFKIMIIYIK